MEQDLICLFENEFLQIRCLYFFTSADHNFRLISKLLYLRLTCVPLLNVLVQMPQFPSVLMINQMFISVHFLHSPCVIKILIYRR